MAFFLGIYSVFIGNPAKIVTIKSYQNPTGSDLLPSVYVSKHEIAPSAESIFLWVCFLYDSDFLCKEPLWTKKFKEGLGAWKSMIDAGRCWGPSCSH